MTTFNMSDDVVWTPRTVRRVVAVVAVEAAVEKATMAADKIKRQWDHLVTALMRVLDDFQDAKAAVIKKFSELEDLETIPAWGI